MESLDLLGFLIVTLSCNVTIVGKVWLVLMVLLRMAVLVLAGHPIYQDEQERFVCNTLQPGCANVCYDVFAPVSHLRFWVLQSVSVLLPYAVFSVYVVHQGAVLAARGPCGSHGAPCSAGRGDPGPGERRRAPRSRPRVPDFSCAYLVQLSLRTLLEAAFGALHYLLFGFLVPKRFSCTRPPCTSVVDCYVSRPTEKSIMMLFIWAVSALSLLLGVADLACSVRGRMLKGRGPLVSEECGALMPPPSHGAGRRVGGWEQEGAPASPGTWIPGAGANGEAGASGQTGLPDEDQNEMMSLASDKLSLACKEPHGEAAREPRSKDSVPQSRLAGPHSCSQLQLSGRLVSSGSAPHLRTKKSEWV
ncbi:gap junction delta-4 protein [Nycticebus coucang]|uniref:gap junction delta-4 protein n=1 Tax=Nycticebus coucang TaxID=9470 RepID=UPI00234CA2B7|nr:gap junction delta-4 protein [Nycticebus coucang]